MARFRFIYATLQANDRVKGEKGIFFFIRAKELQLFNKKHCFLIFLLIISVKLPWCGAVLGFFLVICFLTMFRSSF